MSEWLSVPDGPGWWFDRAPSGYVVPSLVVLAGKTLEHTSKNFTGHRYQRVVFPEPYVLRFSDIEPGWFFRLREDRAECVRQRMVRTIGDPARDYGDWRFITGGPNDLVFFANSTPVIRLRPTAWEVVP